MRDKVAAPDPATASDRADSEAAGLPTPPTAIRAQEAAQTRLARRAVPNLDASRAADTARHPAKRRYRGAGLFASAAAVIVAVVALALHFSLPG